MRRFEQATAHIPDWAQKPLAVVAMAATFGAGGLVLNKGGESTSPVESANAAPLTSAANCGKMEDFENLTVKFNADAFAPEVDQGIDSPKESQAYINANPFADGKKIDPVALSAYMSLVTIPATKNSTNLSSEYIKNFNATLK